jgi:Fic family protein
MGEAYLLACATRTIHVVDRPDALTVEQLAELDAAYEPFPPFRERPKEFADPRWDTAVNAMETAAASADDTTLDEAREQAVRAASVDSAAIEGLYETDRGLTRTVAEQTALWEQKLGSRAPSAVALFEAQLEAFELVLDTATRSLPQVTEAWIRRVHEVVTKPQPTYRAITPQGEQEQKLPRGEYKGKPNHVLLDDGSPHSYAPVAEVGSEMQRLVAELNSSDFADAHPVVQAAYAHYGLVAVHPFADGNGRVARALASAYTYRAARLPLLILADQKRPYWAALAAADRGDAMRFVSFIGVAAASAAEMVTQTIAAASAPRPGEELRALADLQRTIGNLTHQELDALGVRVLTDVEAAIKEELDPPEGVSASVKQFTNRRASAPDGFRRIVQPKNVHVAIALKSAPPASADVTAFAFVFVGAEDESRGIAISIDHAEEPLVFGLADVQPQLSIAARIRLEAFIRRVLGGMLQTLRTNATKALRDQGYRS